MINVILSTEHGLERCGFQCRNKPVKSRHQSEKLVIPDPADLNMDYGCEEPDLCFSRSQVRDPAYALLG